MELEEDSTRPRCVMLFLYAILQVPHGQPVFVRGDYNDVDDRLLQLVLDEDHFDSFNSSTTLLYSSF